VHAGEDQGPACLVAVAGHLGCAAGLGVALAVTRPLTFRVLADGAIYALAFPLGYATVGPVLTLRRPANPIGWLYAASGLFWSSTIPLAPWVNMLFREHRPLPLGAQLNAVAGELVWAPAIACGITLPALLFPDGRLRSRRWRVVVIAAVAGNSMLLGAGLLAGTTTETPVPVGNPRLYAKASGMTWEQFHEVSAGRTHTRRLSTLAETANMAVFMASEKASGMTGTVVNLSMGSLDD
jgi:hypothetical protein